MLTGENGIIKQATYTKESSREAEAREKLEITLFNAYNEKNLNREYNENEFLDDIIKSEIKGAEVKGDISIVDGYAYELDRSVPKIGRYLGKSKDLIFPEIEVTVELAEDRKTAKIKITAIEEKNGINKIEIYQAGEKLDEFKYDNIKEEIKKEYTAKQNGKYTIKVYANIMNSKTVEVDGIVAAVNFEPDGNEEWKKEHRTKVTIQETEDRVIESKYQWTNSVVEPEDETFIENFKSGDTIIMNEVTGKHYLWLMLEMQSGGKVKWRSEAFNFDNEGPIGTLTSTPISQTSFKLTATANDEYSGIEKYEFYVENDLKEIIGIEENTAFYTLNNLNMGTYNCFVIVTDKLGNKTKLTAKETPRTKLYTWEKHNTTTKTTYEIQETKGNGTVSYSQKTTLKALSGLVFNSEKGYWTYTSISSAYTGVDAERANVVIANGPVEKSVISYRKIGRRTGSSVAPDYSNIYHYEYTDYTAVKKSEQVQGTISYGNVYSTRRNEYPDNNKSGSYWYKYLGIE